MRRLLIGLMLFAGGCQQASPTYNRYAPVIKPSPILETADDLMQSAHHALDMIDQRVENAIY